MTLMVGIYPVYGQDEGLIAHWKLDEVNGDQVSDSVGEHNGWLLGYPDDSQWTEGIIDGARMFDGVDDFVWMEEYKGISGGHSRTTAAWIKTAETGNIISWGRQELTRSWCLNVNFSTWGTRGALFLVVMGGVIIGETDLRDNKWHHVAAVLENDGTPDVSEVKLYVDGRLEGFSFVAEGAIDTSDDINVQLGAWTIGISANKYFNGLIDDVRIYNKALSLEEIQALQIKYGGGTGEPNAPYQIHTAAHMQAIGTDPNDWDKHFILMADIDLGSYTGDSFNIIGNYLEPFTGSFDGNGKKISNFIYSTSSEHIIGIFGLANGPDVEIKDLVLIDVNIVSSGDWVGALVGALSGTVTNCSSSGNITGNDSVGGLLGSSSGIVTNCYSTATVFGTLRIGGIAGGNGGTILNCFSAGSVNGGRHAGGLVGENEGSISKCYTMSSVFGTGENTGGFVGINDWGGNTSNCYSMSNVSGSFSSHDNVGGFAGENGMTGEILNCYSAGQVNANTSSTGGLVGLNYNTVTDSFWDTQTSGQSYSAGGSGKTTEQMQTMSTFTDAGWDFTTPIWKMACECGNYPRLQWEVLKYDVGSGTMEDPYLICTAEQMNAIGANPNDWDKCFKLMADIDLSPYTSTQFNIIGTETAPFTGTFDGNGKTISNLSYISTETDYIGLFRCIHALGGGIRNLGLIDPNIIAGEGEYVGSLVGKLSAGWISGCYVLGGRVSGHWSVGGLVGTNDSSSGWLSRCYASSNVSGDACIGGLIGYSRGLINECFSSKSVSSNADVIGGLIGTNHANGEIANSFSSANVFGGRNHTGGIAGMNAGTIFNCYSSGNVMGNSWVGGLVGSGSNGSYTKCFWDNTINPLLTGIGDTTDPNVIGESTVNMHMESTFTNWDFINIWKICEGMNYPKLAWQVPLPGDFVCPDGVEINDLAVLVEQWLLEKLSADISPDGGDGFVDFSDWAVFAAGWQSTPDIDELAIFVEQWLQLGASSADIIPPGRDGIVNMLDFAALADNWLAGVYN